MKIKKHVLFLFIRSTKIGKDGKLGKKMIPPEKQLAETLVMRNWEKQYVRF